jgi:hypothetical protein
MESLNVDDVVKQIANSPSPDFREIQFQAAVVRLLGEIRDGIQYMSQNQTDWEQRRREMGL